MGTSLFDTTNHSFKNNSDDFLHIYSDGGARGNPGPSAAAFVVIRDGKVIFKDAKYLGISTNNVAEYSGVVIALEWLKNNADIIKEKNIKYFLDSQLVVRQLSGLYRVKDPKLKLLFQKIMTIKSGLNLRIIYIHIGREKNKTSDLLVNNKIDENI